jgi:PPM family protein phosphatase
VVLCSDGLSAMVRDEEIARVIEASGRDPHGAAEALVQAANEHGGDDNVTVVVFELVEGEPAERERRGEGSTDGEPRPADPDAVTSESVLDDVIRHGAGKGSRWPALLLVLAILAVAAFAVWWSLVR